MLVLENDPESGTVVDVEDRWTTSADGTAANHTTDANNLTQLIILQRLRSFMNNRAIDDNSLIGLLVAYMILIIVGATGNGFVCIAVARKPHMRTARNVFIINLAISDLILCLFTMPFSLVEITLKFWPMGVLTCKLVAGLQATSIFVSTISITAIALDRYKVIVYPTQDNCRPFTAVFTLTSIWMVSLFLSTPLFWFRTVEHVAVDLPWIADESGMDYCLERWPVRHGRGFYSVFSMLFQYFLPIVILSVAYARICRKLRYRMISKGTKLHEKQQRDKRRIKKTNTLLISIALIFGASWLPLNILNVVSDFFYPFEETSMFRIVFACCHMAGMSSACSNPLLYGWLNDNFRKEFRELLDVSCCDLCSALKSRVTTHPAAPESVVLCAQGGGNPQTSTAPERSVANKYDTYVVVSTRSIK